MIFTDRTIIVQKGTSSINDTIILYRGDKGVEIRFTLNEGSPFRFGSGASQDALKSLKMCLKHRTPKKIMWCMGMNDPDSNSSINSTYKSVLDEVVSICEDENIELILFTIPNVPERNHSFKNSYIKSLNLRYVDVSKCVGAEETTSWYSGLLSSDKVHPDTNGQIVIASKVIAEVSEIVDNFIR